MSSKPFNMKTILPRKRVRRLTVAICAIVLFFAYVCLVNEMSKPTYVTIMRISWFRLLRIPLPAVKEVLLATTILVIIASVLEGSTTNELMIQLILIILCLISYLANVGTWLSLISFVLVVYASKSEYRKLLETFLVVITAISIGALIRHLAYFVLGDEPFVHSSWIVAEIHLTLLTSLQPLSMLAYALLPILPLISYALERTRLIKAIEKRLPQTSWRLSKRSSLALLAVSLVISLSYNTLTYLPSVNPRGTPIGVDISLYRVRLEKMVRGFVIEILRRYPYEMFYLIMLYWIQCITGLAPMTIAKFMPVLLFPLLTLSTYYMMLNLTENRSIATLSALLTATGPQVTVGSYSSFQANALALTLGYTTLGVYLSRQGDTSAALISLLFLMISELTHPWATAHVLAALILLHLSQGRSALRRRAPVILAGLIGVGIGDAIRYIVVQGARGGSAHVTGVSLMLMLRELQANIMRYPYTLYRVVSLYYGGLLNYPLALLVLALPILRSAKIKRFVTSWCITILPEYFVAEMFTPRIFYNVPIGALLALTINKLFGNNASLRNSLLVISLSYATLSLVNIVPPWGRA